MAIKLEQNLKRELTWAFVEDRGKEKFVFITEVEPLHFSFGKLKLKSSSFP